MSDLLVKSFARELNDLLNSLAGEWAWPSPEFGFCLHVFHTSSIKTPAQFGSTELEASELHRLDQAPVLAALGYKFSLGLPTDAALSQRWAEGCARLTSRNPFPADRASFFFRPVELLGMTLGATHCDKVQDAEREWLRKALVEGEQKVSAGEPWAFYLGARAARVMGVDWSPKFSLLLDSLPVEELALLKWICNTDTDHATQLGFADKEKEIEELLLGKVAVDVPAVPDSARAAVVYVGVRASIFRRLESSLERDWQAGRESKDALSLLRTLCTRFHLYARQFAVRHEHRPGITVGDEYDVQDIMHAALNLHFEDVRPEEWTPSYAGSASRTDFLLKKEQIVIEVKMTRSNLKQKEVANQLIIDKERYKSHTDCKTLVCFVYDPDGNLTNPTALENDLSSTEDRVPVTVIVAPKGA